MFNLSRTATLRRQISNGNHQILAPRPSFLIIQNDPTCPPQLIARILQEKKMPFQVVYGYYNDAFFNIDPRMYDGIICLGSRDTAYMDEKYQWMKPVKDFMKTSVYYDIPQLAICIGAQFLAEVCGGKSFECPNGAMCGEYIAKYTKDAENDIIYKKIICSSTFHPNSPVLLAHNDTFSLPKKVKICNNKEIDVKLLIYDKYPIIFKVGDYSYGIQSHPECDEKLREFWLDLDCTHYENKTGIKRKELEELNKKHNKNSIDAGWIMVGDWIDLCKKRKNDKQITSKL